MNQHLLHFKQKMINDFLKLNYEHFTNTTEDTTDNNVDATEADTSIDVSMIDHTETEQNDDTGVEQNTALPYGQHTATSSPTSPPSMGPVMSATDYDNNNNHQDLSSLTTRRQTFGRYI